MSLDLLAELNPYYHNGTEAPAGNEAPRHYSQVASLVREQDCTNGPSPKAELFSGMSNSLITNIAVDVSADDWGEFEGPSIAVVRKDAPNPVREYPGRRMGEKSFQLYGDNAAIASEKVNLDPDLEDKSQRGLLMAQLPTASTASVHRDDNQGDVLFDADVEISLRDDFGDFEIGIPTDSARVYESSKDLSQEELIDFSVPTKAKSGGQYEQSPAVPSPSMKDGTAASTGTSQFVRSGESRSIDKPALATLSIQNGHLLEDLAANSAEDMKWEVHPVERNRVHAQDTPTTHDRSPNVEPAAFMDQLAPTNIPPPAVILSLFPPLFSDAHKKLAQWQDAQSAPFDKKSDDSVTGQHILAYLSFAKVAARIIAGRKLRWKRDKCLSQGMKIGPASSKKSTGMKLTGIDKAENSKEEREVVDVVTLWKNCVGRLRAAVGSIGASQQSKHTIIPKIQENIPVRTANEAEGGISALNPCMLCGLKRNERAVGIDDDAHDSFGEWWIDQLFMHTCESSLCHLSPTRSLTCIHPACWTFWNQQKDALRPR
jgi:hypothetical protein